MAPNRRRGAHAAARSSPAPSAAAKRTPPPAANGGVPSGGEAPPRGANGSRGSGSRGRGSGGKRLSALRSRPPFLRVIAAALVLGFCAAGFAGGLWSSPAAEPTVQAFLLDWQQQNYAAAAALTTGPQVETTSALRNAFRRLDAAGFSLSMGHIYQHGDNATAYFTASVDLGQNGPPWIDHGQFTLHLTDAGWKIPWSPSVINPRLRPGLRLALVSTTPHRMPLLDRNGQPLQVPSPVYVVGVLPGHLASASATAQALGQVTNIDPTEVLGWILAAPRRSFTELVTFKPSQYAQLAARLKKVPGLIIRRENVPLFNSIAPAVVGSVGAEASPALRDQGIAYRPGATVGMSGLQQTYQRRLAGTPATEVVAETPGGRVVSVLERWPGLAPRPVKTTLDAGVQDAARKAVESVPGTAAIVAVQASSGQILAVADHKGAHLPAIDPLDGRYPPGSSFTIVSTEALLESGLGIGSQVRCTRVNDVGGRIFTNVPAEPKLGALPTFAVDFAHACATALAGLSERLTARGLTSSATRFGLGATWQLPLKGFSGTVPTSGGVAQLAAATIGQGNVLVSPLSMAMVAAEVESGNGQEPSLVTVPPDSHQTREHPFSPANLASLRTLMRQAVRSGAAKSADLGGVPVYGQVGTAALGTGKHHKWVSWFVGYRGNVAFAVMEVGATPHVSAVRLGAAFLAAASRL
jgi:cell division protein FtsI/penicillin-binding protein 2